VWKEDHLLRLLKERLAKMELSTFVLGLKLDAGQLQPMAPPTEDLFMEPGGSPEDFDRLLELLAARLGAENVLMPSQEPDHRPEVCNTWVPASAKVREGAPRDPELLERPSLVLPKPIRLLVRNERPFYGSPLGMPRRWARSAGGAAKSLGRTRHSPLGARIRAAVISPG